jgi:hypothetical protein
MNRYETSIPRTAFGLAAIALSALTLGLAVVLPATQTAERQEARGLAAPHVDRPAVREVAIDPARIDVVLDCEQKMAFERAQHLPPKGDLSS